MNRWYIAAIGLLVGNPLASWGERNRPGTLDVKVYDAYKYRPDGQAGRAVLLTYRGGESLGPNDQVEIYSKRGNETFKVGSFTADSIPLLLHPSIGVNTADTIVARSNRFAVEQYRPLVAVRTKADFRLGNRARRARIVDVGEEATQVYRLLPRRTARPPAKKREYGGSSCQKCCYGGSELVVDGKPSRRGKRCRELQEAFLMRETLARVAGSFPDAGNLGASCRKLSRRGKPCC